MSSGSFYSSRESLTETITRDFFYNRSLQQTGLVLSLGEHADDIRSDVRLVGGALLKQQDLAARRHARAAEATTAAVERQTAEVTRLREEQAVHARELRSAVEDAAQLVATRVEATTKAVQEIKGALVDQLSHVRWALAEQNQTLRDIFKMLRESRSNECRQLVEQGERNLRAGYYAEAEERLTLALTYDNVDYFVHQNLGLVSVRLAKPDHALAHFQKALAFPPKQSWQFFAARAATHAARVLYAMRRYDEAAKYLETAISYESTAAKNWYDLAVVEAYRGNAEAACTVLTRAIAEDPDYYAQALVDPELDPVRDAVDGLLVRLRDERRAALAALAPTVAPLEGCVADVLEAVGNSRAIPANDRHHFALLLAYGDRPMFRPAFPADLRTRIRAAQARDTFFGYAALMSEVRKLRGELPEQFYYALDEAIERLNSTYSNALIDLTIRSESRERQREKEYWPLQAEASKRGDNVFLYIFLTTPVGAVAGIVVGAMADGFNGGCSGFFLGLFAPAVIFRTWAHLRERRVAAAEAETYAEFVRFRASVRAQETDLKASHERDVARLTAVRDQVWQVLRALPPLPP